MKKALNILIMLLIIHITLNAENVPIIIDHQCTDIDEIPSEWIEKAKQDFRLGYGHTSHGSQIISGIQVIQSENDFFQFNKGEGSLYIKDRISDTEYKARDLGNPDFSAWAATTENILNDNSSDLNMIMWSWCGQVSHASDEQMDQYLDQMNDLENQFPDVTFIYMTGHLDGSGLDGSLHINNEKIRDYCRENNKILFDFADIESYDPDGNYFLDKGADDRCNYDGGNWAIQWCDDNPGKCPECSCAHSHCLNCYQKGKAFWWMMARLAGWNGQSSSSVEQDSVSSNNIILDQNVPNPVTGGETTFKFYLPKEDFVTLRIFDINGNEMATVVNSVKYPKGWSEVPYGGVNELVQGTYEYVLEAGGKVSSKRMVVVR